MNAPSPAFEKTYQLYLERLGGLDLAALAARLGLEREGDGVILPFLTRPHRAAPSGIRDPEGGRPPLGLCVALCRYLMSAAEATAGVAAEPATGVTGEATAGVAPEPAAGVAAGANRDRRDREWTAYRDFKDAGPLVGYYASNVEGAIAAAGAGRVSDLARAADALGAGPPEADFPYDLTRILPVFPDLPALLLFNDADEMFPARCALLFQRRAQRYLDMESLAIAGALTAEAVSRGITPRTSRRSARHTG